MSFADCIKNHTIITDRQKSELLAEYEKLRMTYSKTMGDANAGEAAAANFVQVKTAQLAQKTKNAKRDVLAWKQIIQPKIKKIAKANDAERESASKGTKWLFGKSGTARAVRRILEETIIRQQSIEGRSHRALADIIEKYRARLGGLKQDTEGFVPVVEAAMGKRGNDNEANAAGDAIRQVFDALHRMYQQAGGVIGKLDNYFPQAHNPFLVRGKGDKGEAFQRWRTVMLDNLDMSRMIDDRTGLPFTDADLLVRMQDDFEGIISNGLDEVARRAEAGKQTFGKGGGVAMRHSSSRFYHFKDADSFLAYNREFGFGDEGLFNVMMGHISTMARDIALMQELGPKPEAMMARMNMMIEADGAGPQAVRTTQGMYDVLAGRNGYNGKLPFWYDSVLVPLQNWQRAALLQGTPISAMTDSFYIAYTAKMNGLKATRVLGEYMKQLNPASSEDRRIARRIAVISGAANGISISKAMRADDYGSKRLTGWLAQFTNSATGLGAMTDGARASIPLGTMGFMAESKALGHTWTDMNPVMQEALRRWDMGPVEFAEIMQAKPHVEGEADFIRPEDVALSGFSNTARKYEMWIQDMMQDASNEPRLLTRAISTGAVLGEARPGTVLRATASSLMMFKSFGVTVILNHTLPALQAAATARGLDRISRIAPLIIGTTIMGALSIQARQVIYGGEPRDMDAPKFWASASLQGGGFGILGDFFLGDYSRHNQSLESTLAGPLVGFASDALRVTKGNFDRTLDPDQESKFLADAWQFLRKEMPLTRLWYMRMVTERMLLDQAERMIDPNFDKRMRRLENKMRKQNGQEFWWAPGDALPRFAQ